MQAAKLLAFSVHLVTHFTGLAPFPDSDEDDLPESVKDQVLHVRLDEILWIWIRYEARRAQVKPAAWIRRAIHEFDDEGVREEVIKEKVLHVRVDRETWQRIQKFSRMREHWRPPDVVRRAIRSALLATKEE